MCLKSAGPYTLRRLPCAALMRVILLSGFMGCWGLPRNDALKLQIHSQSSAGVRVSTLCCTPCNKRWPSLTTLTLRGGTDFESEVGGVTLSCGGGNHRHNDADRRNGKREAGNFAGLSICTRNGGASNVTQNSNGDWMCGNQESKFCHSSSAKASKNSPQSQGDESASKQHRGQRPQNPPHSIDAKTLHPLKSAISKETQAVFTKMLVGNTSQSGSSDFRAVDPDGGVREGVRYWRDKEGVWRLVKEEGEDWSVESLRGPWNFPASDCLTFRLRKPDAWGCEPWHPTFGWFEFFIYMSPGLNILLKLFRGLWPCAVCGLARSRHPLWSTFEADREFWDAVARRDIELAVRLVKGGVDCSPRSETWCLLIYVMANYCKDPYKTVKYSSIPLSNDHLKGGATQEFKTCWWTAVPFL